MSKMPIQTAQALAAIGPYAQAVRAGNLLFVSGQIPLDPATGQMVAGDITVQTERVLKTTVYFRDLEDFGKMNAVYAKFLGEDPPARATVQAARLPRDAGVEIDLIAEV